MRLSPLVFLIFMLQGHAQDADGILTRNEGELLDLPFGPWIIKASPRTGTQGSELHWFAADPGFSTGLHVHLEADELFYVVKGEGRATINQSEAPIGEGDVIFIPKGSDHRLVNTNPDQPLVLLFFLDKPGLADEARESYRRYLADPTEETTLESLNEIANKFGTVYKTLY